MNQLTPNRAPHLTKEMPADRWHLARTDEEAELASFEFSLERVIHAYYGWKAECLGAVAEGSFSGNDTAVLNTIRLRDRPKGLSEIGRLLNRDDTSNIQYSIRKLLKAGLIEKAEAASRKATSYRVTERGRAVTDAYAELRADLLLALTRSIGDRSEGFGMAEQLLNLMAGMYDQAAKLAAARRG
jgi:predicted MarR family transcription regulator